MSLSVSNSPKKVVQRNKPKFLRLVKASLNRSLQHHQEMLVVDICHWKHATERAYRQLCLLTPTDPITVRQLIDFAMSTMERSSEVVTVTANYATNGSRPQIVMAEMWATRESLDQLPTSVSNKFQQTRVLDHVSCTNKLLLMFS